MLLFFKNLYRHIHQSFLDETFLSEILLSIIFKIYLTRNFHKKVIQHLTTK